MTTPTRPQGYRAPTDEELLREGPIPGGALRVNETGEWVPFYHDHWDRLWTAAAFAVPDTQQPVTLSDPKQAHGEKKPQLHLIPLAAQEEMARALELGARKYGERNWVLGDGVNLTTYLSAMARHLALITDGKEDVDPESGAHHLGHIMAGCGIVLDALRHGKLIDNRVKPQP